MDRTKNKVSNINFQGIAEPSAWMLFAIGIIRTAFFAENEVNGHSSDWVLTKPRRIRFSETARGSRKLSR